MKSKKSHACRGILLMSLMNGLCRLTLCSMILVFCILSLSGTLWGEEQPPESPFAKGDRPHPEKTMTAARANSIPPRIDGVLDDQVWQYAPAYDDFTQREPEKGAAPTERTTVQIAYDDQALYVGFMCYDSEPEKIVARLGRRDQRQEDDSVAVCLDTHHDHQTGYFFIVSAAGV